MRILMLGAASLALAASATYADPGKGGGGNGGGHGGHGGGQAASASPDQSGGGKGHGGGQAKADKGPSGSGKVEHSAQGNGQGARPAAKAEQRAIAHGDKDRGSKANGKAKDRVESGRAVTRGVGQDRDARFDQRGNESRNVRTVVSFGRDTSRGLIEGCPPGLAKKNNGCTPPGLARDGGDRDGYYRPSWFGYPSLGDGRYYYDDGYLYRTGNTGSVLGYIPLLGGALSVGNPWPNYYDPAPVPDYYVDYYNLGSPDSYRYADDVLYRVDPQTDAISSIAALLTGDQFDVGQRMPSGYDVYNVPDAYRDQYYDTPETDYRYADGYVYQVDPTTQLIQAAIQLLT
jgi:hypothetical protein